MQAQVPSEGGLYDLLYHSIFFVFYSDGITKGYSTQNITHMMTPDSASFHSIGSVRELILRKKKIF